MQKFLFKLTWFFLPILVLGIGLEYGVRNIPNDYSYKKSFLDNKAKDIDVLVLGSSHAYRGINPDFFKENAFNAAYVSQTMEYDNKIFRKFSDKLDSLKVVVWAISYNSLFAKLEHEKEYWRKKNYAIYYDVPVSYSFQDNTELLGNTLKVTLSKIIKYYIKHEDFITTDKHGFGHRTGNRDVNFETNGAEAVKRHTKSNDYLGYNLKLLKEFINETEKRGIKLLIVTTPTYKTYYSKLDSNQMNETTLALKTVAANNSSVEYRDFLKDSRFNKNDFYDADHLNDQGAHKFSLMLDSIVNTMMNR